MSNARCESLVTSVVALRGEQTGPARSFRRALSSALDKIYLWQERASQRAHLAALDDHLLKDLGISRAQAVQEAAKPFWRA
jgi:uncharacterized protein YjiS (DUF1127 family)